MEAVEAVEEDSKEPTIEQAIEELRPMLDPPEGSKRGEKIYLLFRANGRSGTENIRLDVYYLMHDRPGSCTDPDEFTEPYFIWITPLVAKVTGVTYDKKTRHIRMQGRATLCGQNLVSLLSLSLHGMEGQNIGNTIRYEWL